MSTESDAPTTSPAVTVTTTVDAGQFGELSKRVDQTHEAVVLLDGRFETHRSHTNEALDDIKGGISVIMQNQAAQHGREKAIAEAAVEATSRRSTKATNRNTFATAASVFATVLSVAAVVGSFVIH